MVPGLRSVHSNSLANQLSAMGFYVDSMIAFFWIVVYKKGVSNNRRMKRKTEKKIIIIICRLDTYLPAAMNIMTATIIVPQIAALAAIVILSMFDVGESVLTSRHCEYGTLSGDTFNSSNDITHTTMHSCGGTFFILNSRSLASSGGPCLKLLSANNR